MLLLISNCYVYLTWFYCESRLLSVSVHIVIIDSIMINFVILSLLVSVSSLCYRYNCCNIAIILFIGYDISKVREFDKAKPFFRNIFIIKPQILLAISTFIIKAMKLVMSDYSLSALFKVKHISKNKPKILNAIFKPTKYQNLHPFIFERLPAFYLYHMKAKVCIDMTSGPCIANTEFFHYDGDNLVIDKN